MNIPPCLIFNNYPTRPTDGGPSGFLAQNLAGHQSRFYRLGHSHGEPPYSRWQRLRQGYVSYDRDHTLEKIGMAPDNYFSPLVLAARHTFKREVAGEYPWIWFHDVWTMSGCLDLIQPGQKIMLQSHCPELPSEEAAGLGLKATDIAWTEEVQQRVFDRADVVVFPNAGARSIYDRVLKDGARVEYLLSGCQGLKPRCQLPLDPRNIYYLYLGRRNAVKGFDIVLEAFKQASQEDASLRLIIVGGGEAVDHPGVIDIGRSEDPGLWIANCDYFVNANRQSYFDLSVMEALSLGAPLIIACGQGHQFYAEVSSPGIVTLAHADGGLLTKAMLSNRVKRFANTQAAAANRALFDEQLSSNQYRERLDQFLERVLVV